jgi:bla regulator protein BlaR1
MESLVHALLSNAVAATILVVLVAVIGRSCRRPALVHALCLIVLLKLVTPPLVHVSLPVGLNLAPEQWSRGEIREDLQESIASAEMSRRLTVAAVNEPWDGRDDPGMSLVNSPEVGAGATSEGTPKISSRAWSRDIGLPAGWSWEHLVLAVVLSGAIAWWGLALTRIMRFQRLMKEIEPASEEWQRRTVELARRLGLAGAPSLCLVPGRVPPMLWAIGGRPRLLVPSELWSETSVDERTALLLHELAHLKRRDHWVRWLELIVVGLYWWHPAVWWGRRLLREAEEQCCDAWVIWVMPQGAKTYATALLAAIEFVSGARTAPAASLAASGNGHVSCLKRRLKMIVRARTPKGLSWAGRLAVLGLTALLLPLAPSWGQKSDAESKQDQGQKEDKSRATAERFEEHVKGLVEKLTKELGPVGEEIRKTLEKSIDEIHETLKKEGVTSDDVRKAVEKSHNEVRKAFEKGGSINKEVRESMEKSRRDLQQEWERARGELRSEARERLESRRQQERGRDVEKSDSGANDAAEMERQRAELEKARSEVRALEQQLRQANRRLVELQRRMMPRGGGGSGSARRGDVPAGRVAPGRAPEDQPAPRAGGSRSPRPGSPPVDGEQPRRVAPFGARLRPESEGAQDSVSGSGGNENRLREVENKLERVLKELEELKANKKSEEPKDSSSRSRRPARSGGAPTIL